MRAVYRVQQGLANLKATVSPEDLELARRYLSSSEMGLFLQMSPADQRHSVQVLRTLLQTDVSDRSLIKAALLHDVGKSRCRITVFHRTVAVLLGPLLDRLLPIRCHAEDRNWWLPFYVIVNHSRIGASMLARAGCEERVWRLVELHQLEPHRVGTLPDHQWVREALATLQQADNLN